MKNYQDREFSRTSVRPKGDVHDCMDAGGTTPWMGELESRLEQRSRATQEQLPRDVCHE
jgi:hypothetical protein